MLNTPLRLPVVALLTVLFSVSLWVSTSPADAAPFKVPASAHAQGIVVDEDAHVELRLLSDAVAVRPGDQFTVGVQFEIDRGWHIYWDNPGESGLPTKIEWTVEPGTSSPTHYPAPLVFEEADGLLTTYGYAREAFFFSEAIAAPDAVGEIELRAEINYLACKLECIPGRASLHRTLPIAAATAPANDRLLEYFQHYAERIPRTPQELGLEIEVLLSQDRVRPGDRFQAAVALVACPDHSDRPHVCPEVRAGVRNVVDLFVPGKLPSIKLAATDSRAHPLVPSGWLVTLEGEVDPNAAVEDALFEGVMALKSDDGNPIWAAIELAIPMAPPGSEVAKVEHAWLAPRANAADTLSLPVWQALGLGLIGGLILNLMPCVLPILAIKLFSITQLAHEGRRTVLLHGAAYASGTIVTMLALAVAVLSLKAAGTAVGWGFQFQEPLFIAGVSTVLVVFAMNLFGVFEIYAQGGQLSQLSAQASGARRSFFEGLLAVVVATPCSAPFLGTAVGFALASPAPIVLAIFAMIGLGLALPYVLVTLVPGWARLMPKPGSWMQTLRSLLGFGLLGTVVWLVSLIGGTYGPGAMTRLLIFLLVATCAAWLYGATQESSTLRRRVALTLGLALVLAAGPFTLHFELAAKETNGTEYGIAWRPFDPAAIQQSLAERHPVLVDFTADWCITCGVNERLVLGSEVVNHELERLGVVSYKADWTLRDETIRAELARYGRAGVPMYLVYDPDTPDAPEVLPELLTIDRVIDALRQAADEP